MEYKDLPPEFGRWLGMQEDEEFFIFVQPVEGSGANVKIVSDPLQVQAAYQGYMRAFIERGILIMQALEDAEEARALEEDEEDE